MWLKTQNNEFINMDKIAGIFEKDKCIYAVSASFGEQKIELAKFSDFKKTIRAVQEIQQALKEGKKLIDLSNN